MKVQLDFLTNTLLHDLDPKSYGNSGASFEPFSLSLFDKKASILDGAINIGMASALPESIPPLKSMTCVICIGDQDIPQDYKKKEGGNLSTIVVSNQPSLIEVYRRVNTIFERENVNIKDLIQFARLSSSEAQNSELVKSASKILDCSVALLSHNFRLLGEYTIEGESDKAWNYMREKKYYPNMSITNSLNASEIVVVDPATNAVVTSRALFPEQGTAFLEIRSSSRHARVLGYLLAYYSSASTFSRMMDTMYFIGATLSYRLWHNINTSANRNSAVSFMMRELLCNPVITDEEIQKMASNIDLKLQKNLYLLVINASANENHTVSLDYLVTVFSTIWSNDIVFTFEADIVAILSRQEEHLPNSFFHTLDETLEKYNLYAGISQPFTQIDRLLYNRFVRARSAAKTASIFKISPRYVAYYKIALLHFICEGRTYSDLRSLCDPQLLKLLAMDKAGGTDYLHTMKSYWHFNKNIVQTCDYLHIHRNTLFYRLKRIREILGQDICSSKDFAALRLSLAILEYTGEVKLTNFPVNFSESEDAQV